MHSADAKQQSLRCLDSKSVILQAGDSVLILRVLLGFQSIPYSPKTVVV